MQGFHGLMYFRMSTILPVLVCIEIITLLIFCRKKGIIFGGQRLLLCGMICFLLGTIFNLLTSFGFFMISAGEEGAFTVHPSFFGAKGIYIY